MERKNANDEKKAIQAKFTNIAGKHLPELSEAMELFAEAFVREQAMMSVSGQPKYENWKNMAHWMLFMADALRALTTDQLKK